MPFPDAGFLAQLPQGRLDRGFPLVDPALRHLPGGRVHVRPLPGKDAALPVRQDDTDAGPVGQGRDLVRRHRAPYWALGPSAFSPVRMSMA
jgi:hypothetical protein